MITYSECIDCGKSKKPDQFAQGQSCRRKSEVKFDNKSLYSKTIFEKLNNDISKENAEIKEKFFIEAVKKDCKLLSNIKNPSYQVQAIAINSQPAIIKEINNPCEDLQLLAIKKDPMILTMITKPTEKVQLEAVKQVSDTKKIAFLTYMTLSKITNPIALQILYSKNTDKYYKEKIKKSPYWKDDANLILDNFNN